MECFSIIFYKSAGCKCWCGITQNISHIELKAGLKFCFSDYWCFRETSISVEKKLKSPWRKVMGVSSDVWHKSLLSRSPVFFSFFQPEGHFFPLPTSLWHIPMRKSRHHKAARTEMEKLRAGTTRWHSCLCGRVRGKKAEFIIGIIILFYFFLHVSACWPFSKCWHIRESASKNGGKEYSGTLIGLKQKVIERKKKLRSGEAQVMEGVVSRMRKQRQHVQCGISERSLSSSRRAQTIPGSDKEHSPDSISWILDTLMLMVEKRYSNLSLTTFNQWCQSLTKGWIDWKTINSSCFLYSVISMCYFHKPKSTNGKEQMFTHVLILFREIPNGRTDTDCITHMLPLMSSHK